jgi:hypothetical protein
MAGHAHDMGLLAVGIAGIAHGFAVDGQHGVLWSEGLMVVFKSAVEMVGVDPNHDIANDRFAGHNVVSVDSPAAKSLSGFSTEALGPVGDGLITAHAAQGGGRCDGQHGGQRMASSLGATGVGNREEELIEGLHLLGT